MAPPQAPQLPLSLADINIADLDVTQIDLSAIQPTNVNEVLFVALVKQLQERAPRRYKCDECDKTFSKKYNLRAHYRLHSGETPFKCNHPGCDKSFKWKSSLKSHLSAHVRDDTSAASSSSGSVSTRPEKRPREGPEPELEKQRPRAAEPPNLLLKLDNDETDVSATSQLPKCLISPSLFAFGTHFEGGFMTSLRSPAKP
mmetsp:Transcript_33852/g.83012  ORF Transcript_33852/g.83012 Transcript_33852/m.83012 type:complete len:200 (+) Transcript_33852:381-980(+)